MPDTQGCLFRRSRRLEVNLPHISRGPAQYRTHGRLHTREDHTAKKRRQKYGTTAKTRSLKKRRMTAVTSHCPEISDGWEQKDPTSIQEVAGGGGKVLLMFGHTHSFTYCCACTVFWAGRRSGRAAPDTRRQSQAY